MTRQGETPMVIGTDIILDLVFARGRGALDAVMLFDAIVADTAAGVTSRRAYVAPVTVSEVYSIVLHEAGLGKARSVAWRLLDVVHVAPTGNSEYKEAAMLSSDYEFAEALQFAACRSVGAKFFVTNEDFGVKRAPVPRRSAAEMLPLFKRQALPEDGTAEA